MRKVNNRLVLLVCIFFLMSSQKCQEDSECDAPGSHNGLVMKNESDQRIYVELYWNYPDTSIGSYNPVRNATGGILPNTEFARGAGMGGACWESIFANERKEWVHIFDADTIESLDWLVVQQTGRGLLERRRVDLNYLIQNDFTIVYK